MDRRQVLEARAALGGIRIYAVDPVYPDHAPVLLTLARGADRAADAIADAESEATDLARRNVNVVRRRHEAVAAHEPEAFLDDIQDAGRVGVACQLALTRQDPVDEFFLAGAFLFHLEVAADRLQLVDAHPGQFVDVEVAAVAILEFVVLRHWCPAGGTSARAAVA